MADAAASAGNDPPVAKAEVSSSSVPPNGSKTATATAIGEGVFTNVPDPDEDDLDDLDDLLDDFSASKDSDGGNWSKPLDTKTKAAPAGTEAAVASGEEPSLEDVLSDDEFAKQLQAGMADLLGELEHSPEMQTQFDTIFRGLSGAEGPEEEAPAVPGPSVVKPSSTTEASFQETIRATMDRMKASGEQATAASREDGADDFLAQLLGEMQQQTGGAGGVESDEELSKMLLGIMEQLTNKEILYKPMKELDDKYPCWMDNNRARTSETDLKRYEEQHRLVREIVARFETATYADSNAADREYIVDRMQQIQAAGSPPADLIGDMPSARDAFNMNMSDDACNPQ